MDNGTSLGNLLDSSRDSRIKIFLSNLDSHFEEFTDAVVGGTLCKIPVKDKIQNKSFKKFRIKPPIGYETTTKYRLRLKGHVYDLYKFNCNYYFIDIPKQSIVTKSLIQDYMANIRFSFIFYLLYANLAELTKGGLTINLEDYLFCGLLDRYHDKQGELRLTLTQSSVPNKEMTTNHLYISLFN